MPVRHLPEEILVLICEELGKRRDFPTLFQCAISSVSFSEPALRVMYRIHHLSPLIHDTDELENLRRHKAGNYSIKAAQQETQLRKWALIWRSIIRSSLDLTYKPYCLYIRFLDLDNLGDLLQESRFAGRIEQKFFSGELQEFFLCDELPSTQPSKSRRKNRSTVDVLSVFHAIGEAVTKKTRLLEELKGDISGAFLPHWIRRLPRLQGLYLKQGHALGAEAQAAIRENCPLFKSLTMLAWTESNADEHLAALLNTTSGWENFELYRKSEIGRRSLTAMNHHGRTLISLKLLGLNDEAVKSLGCLKECNALQKLELEASAPWFWSEEIVNEPFSEIVSWLTSCHDLKELSLANIRHAPSILAQPLSTHSFSLASLSVKKYDTYGKKARAFYASIAEQAGLLRVFLDGDGEDSFGGSEVEIFVESLCRLSNLQSLTLNQMPDDFTENDIISLAKHLPSLETFYPSGCDCTDKVLQYLAKLKKLKDMQFFGTTFFTAAGIADFISSLDVDTNKGLVLNMWAVDRDHALSEDAQASLRELIGNRLDGRFSMTLAEQDSDFDTDGD